VNVARAMPRVPTAAFALVLALWGPDPRTAPGSDPGAQPSLAVALPEGEGKALVERACAGCHDPSLVIFKREDEEGWAVIVNDMAARGAKATEEELKIITAYLAEHFNRESTFSPLQGMGPAAPGKDIYQTLCVVCHQPDGRGRDKVAPPLVGSPLVLGPAAIPVRIMLHGKRGPTNVMPALGALMTDEQIAAVLTYVRREWDQRGSAIDAATVKNIREATAGRARPWTVEELQQVAGQPGKGASYD
jgi:mono/diheme cytochrome c family protein